MQKVNEFILRISSEELEAMIRKRIGYDLEHYGGVLPREVAISWSGYLQGVGEWSPVLAPGVIGRLRSLLPPIENDPVDPQDRD